MNLTEAHHIMKGLADALEGLLDRLVYDDARPFADSGMSADGSDVTTSHDLRSERSGRGDGRTYTITAIATFDGDECSTMFEVEVPHDMRSSNAPAKKDKQAEPETANA